MFDLTMPANAKLFFKILVTIATFDVIPSDAIMDWIGQYIRSSHVINETPQSFVEFNFEDSDPI